MTIERNARKEARNRLMSPCIGLLFMDPLLLLQAADHAWVRTIQEIRALRGRRRRAQRCDRDAESGIITCLHGMKQRFALPVRNAH